MAGTCCTQGVRRSANKVSAWKSEGKRLLGRFGRRREDNIKTCVGLIVREA